MIPEHVDHDAGNVMDGDCTGTPVITPYHAAVSRPDAMYWAYFIISTLPPSNVL